MPREKRKKDRDKETEPRKGGPRTPEGKARSRLNAWRHGLASESPVVERVERAEDWEWLRAGVREYLAAEGVLEEALAERIASTIWRLFRAVRYETESIASYIDEVPRDWKIGRQALGQPIPEELTDEMVREMDRMLIARLLPDEATLERVMRYETKHHRILLQTLHQFLVLKGARKPGRTFGGIPMLGAPGRYGPWPSRLRSVNEFNGEDGDVQPGEEGADGTE